MDLKEATERLEGILITTIERDPLSSSAIANYAKALETCYRIQAIKGKQIELEPDKVKDITDHQADRDRSLVQQSRVR